MYFQQYYLGCLSHASYLIGDTQSGRAVVVDTQRDVSQYLADAASNGLTITTVIVTIVFAIITSSSPTSPPVPSPSLSSSSSPSPSS
jgi:hypothetical protein